MIVFICYKVEQTIIDVGMFGEAWHCIANIFLWKSLFMLIIYLYKSKVLIKNQLFKASIQSVHIVLDFRLTSSQFFIYTTSFFFIHEKISILFNTVIRYFCNGQFFNKTKLDFIYRNLPCAFFIEWKDPP